MVYQLMLAAKALWPLGRLHTATTHLLPELLCHLTTRTTGVGSAIDRERGATTCRKWTSRVSTSAVM